MDKSVYLMENILKRYLLILFCIFLSGCSGPANPVGYANPQPLTASSSPKLNAKTPSPVTTNSLSTPTAVSYTHLTLPTILLV